MNLAWAETATAKAQQMNRTTRPMGKNKMSFILFGTESCVRCSAFRRHPIVTGPGASVPKDDANWIKRDASRMGLIPARQGRDSPVGQRFHFPRFAHAVAVRVVPEGEALQLVPPQHAVVVVIKRGQRVITVLPENPEGHIAHQLESGGDLTVPIMIEHKPCGLGRDPTPAAVETAAVEVKADIRLRIDQVSDITVLLQRNENWGYTAPLFHHNRALALQLSDLVRVTFPIQQWEHIANGLLGEPRSEQGFLVLLLGPGKFKSLSISGQCRVCRSGFVETPSQSQMRWNMIGIQGNRLLIERDDVRQVLPGREFLGWIGGRLYVPWR